MYYPGMQATVNGRAAPVLRADLFCSAVPVPAGDVRATLAYVPTGILLSGLLSALFAEFLLQSTLQATAPTVRMAEEPPAGLPRT